MARHRRRRWLVGLLMLVLSIGAGVLAVDYVRFLHGPLQPHADKTAIFTIDPGTPVRRIAHRLAERGLIDRPLYFRLTARATGDARRLQAGEYAIDPNTTPYRLLHKLVRGDVVTHDLTVIEGWTFADMMAAIRDNDVLKHTLQGKSADDIMALLGHPEENAEGRFFPDTYQFPRGLTDRELLQRAYKRMQSVLDEEWPQRDEDLPLKTPYDALILASIVERETGVADERARVAGVFVERLERGMRLQTDPTVIYGLGDDYHGDIRFRHLKQDTPYNTYTRAGLTPTPIALPSRAAIHASLHPERRGELYFVATGKGRHVFSKTLKAHRKAVAKYQLNSTGGRE